MVTMNVPELSSNHQYTESEALAVEGLQAYWKNNNISEEVLRQRLSDEVFSGLSETDKEEIISDIISSDPHPKVPSNQTGIHPYGTPPSSRGPNPE